jgi:dTDP-4-amino-4,6-dideoxygalactose transaminase
LMGWNLRSGDEVVTSPLTFIASSEAISQAGGTIRFADIDPVTLTLDAADVRRRAGERTRVIMPVHLYGQMCDMPAFMKLAAERRLYVLEDACQAHGSALRGKRAGAWGHAAAFSFYPTKNLGAFGDAGMLVTDDQRLAAQVRLLANHGQVERYTHVLEGFNSRLDAFQALVLLAKMKHLQDWIKQRGEIAAMYSTLLAGVDEVQVPALPPTSKPAYYLYAIRATRRDRLHKFLAAQGIETSSVYATPLHLQEAYRHLGYRQGSFPHAEAAARQILCLPLYPGLLRTSIRQVALQIRRFYQQRPAAQRAGRK